MGSEQPLDVGRLFGALAGQVRQNVLAIVVALVVLVSGNLAMDQWLPLQSTFAAGGLLTLVVQYFLARSALVRSDLLAPDADHRFLSFWGMSILTGLATIVGFVFLILPGLYLNARWLIAGPIILGEDKTAGEGMGESWESMKTSVWPVVGATLLLYVIAFGVGMTPTIYYGEEEVPLAIEAVGYLFVYLASVFGWLMAVGAYALIREPTASLEEIFA